jgi:putative transposase
VIVGGDANERERWVSEDRREAEALWRYGLIRDLLSVELSARERGALARGLAAGVHRYVDGSLRSVSRTTIGRWVRAYRLGGFRGLYPRVRRIRPRTDGALLVLAVALKAEAPERTGAQIAEIIARHEAREAEREGRAVRRCPAVRTVQRHLERAGHGGRRSRAPQGPRYRRFEAERPNELWIADCLHGPSVAGRKAILICLLDDHSRYIPGARFVYAEWIVRLEGVLRSAFQAHGLPARLYCDNGSIFTSGQLVRICARLGIALVHSRPGRPEGRGKLERFFATLRGRFLRELAARPEPVGELGELNRLLWAWLARVYHRRVHSETGESPAERYARVTPRYAADRELMEAFVWSELRRVGPRVATVSLYGNAYEVDAALRGRTVELRFDPHELRRIEVFHDGRSFGLAKPFLVSRHAHPRAAPEPPPADNTPPRTGIDYLDLLEREHQRSQRGIDYRALPGADGREHGADGHDRENDENKETDA